MAVGLLPRYMSTGGAIDGILRLPVTARMIQLRGRHVDLTNSNFVRAITID